MTKTFFLLVLMLAALGCGKDGDSPTIIKGTVTDRKTGAPIEGAYVRIGGKKLVNGLDEYFTPYTPNTGVDGSFSCTLEGDYSSLDIGRKGYLTKVNGGWKIVNGEENQIEVRLFPRDGFLKLKIENTTGQYDTLYLSVYSATEGIEGDGFYYGSPIKTYPLSCKLGEKYTEIVSMTSPEMVYVDWKFKKPTYQIPYTFRDSILIATGDTAIFTLPY